MEISRLLGDRFLSSSPLSSVLDSSSMSLAELKISSGLLDETLCFRRGVGESLVVDRLDIIEPQSLRFLCSSQNSDFRFSFCCGEAFDTIAVSSSTCGKCSELSILQLPAKHHNNVHAIFKFLLSCSSMMQKENRTPKKLPWLHTMGGWSG
jgi:hypothetical protein